MIGMIGCMKQSLSGCVKYVGRMHIQSAGLDTTQIECVCVMWPACNKSFQRLSTFMPSSYISCVISGCDMTWIAIHLWLKKKTGASKIWKFLISFFFLKKKPYLFCSVLRWSVHLGFYFFLNWTNIFTDVFEWRIYIYKWCSLVLLTRNFKTKAFLSTMQYLMNREIHTFYYLLSLSLSLSIANHGNVHCPTWFSTSSLN